MYRPVVCSNKCMDFLVGLSASYVWLAVVVTRTFLNLNRDFYFSTQSFLDNIV